MKKGSELVACEGYGQPPGAKMSRSVGMCEECGALRGLDKDGNVELHWRKLELHPEDSVGYVAFEGEAAEHYWGDVW